jgi:hypothetical protein
MRCIRHRRGLVRLKVLTWRGTFSRKLCLSSSATGGRFQPTTGIPRCCSSCSTAASLLPNRQTNPAEHGHGYRLTPIFRCCYPQVDHKGIHRLIGGKSRKIPLPGTCPSCLGSRSTVGRPTDVVPPGPGGPLRWHDVRPPRSAGGNRPGVSLTLRPWMFKERKVGVNSPTSDDRVNLPILQRIDGGPGHTDRSSPRLHLTGRGFPVPISVGRRYGFGPLSKEQVAR